MELYPAIDLRGGRCVRLAQGDFGRETVYGDDPLAVARAFAAAGTRWIHVVDLDAARTGRAENRRVIGALVKAVRPVRVQVGGGVRRVADAAALWRVGVERVVVGTAAIEDPAFATGLARGHPGRVALGLDTRDGAVAVRGWEATAGEGRAEVLAALDLDAFAALVVTDIGRDGMLEGPDVDGLRAVLDEVPIDVIASGGVRSLDDLHVLAALRSPSGRALAGTIVGRALYEGRFQVAEGVQACAASG